MRLHQQLRQGERVTPIASIKAMLSNNTAGRAVVTTTTALDVGQLLSIELGYDEVRTWFTGFVESTEQMTAVYHRAIIREPAAILASTLPISMVHPTLRHLLDNITAQTGLVFCCSDIDAAKQIANITHAGTGYALMAQLGMMFAIERYTWFSQPDGSIWLGDWDDCHWATRPIDIDPRLYSGEKVATGVQIPMLSAVRPDCLLNGKRVGNVLFDGTQLTLQWHKKESDTQRDMKQQFPELGSLTHLALLGRVVAIGEAVSPGHIQTTYRPAFGVDVQMINPDGSDNTAVPVFRNVPLPGATHHGQGQFAYPQTDCVVELGFAFGHTHQPFVRTILGLNWSMPGVNNGDHLTKANEGFHRIDSGGSQQFHSEQEIELTSQGMTLNTDHLNQTLGEHARQVDGHDTESSLGHRVIQANILSLLGLSGLQLGTDKDYELLAKGSLLETVANLRQSIAKTHWAGNKDTNIYQLLLQIMSVVEALAKTAASHQHTSSKSGAPTSAPLQAGDFTGQSSNAKQLQTTLSPLI